MKIISLQAENVKKLVAVHITPQGDIVEIVGKNGHGKTSVLDSIWWALEGAEHIQAEPIRKGADKAVIRLDLGELIVKRTITPKGGTLTVENAEGARYPSPQAVLDKLLGAISFDPLAFTRMKAPEQFKELRKLVPLSVDVDRLQKDNETDYTKRTEVNRQVKTLTAQIEAMPVEQLESFVPVDTSGLLTQMTEASKHNVTIAEKIRDWENQQSSKAEQKLTIEKDVTDKRKRTQRLLDEAAKLSGEVEIHLGQIKSLEAQLQEPVPDFGSTVDIANIHKQVEDANILNAAIERHHKRNAVVQNRDMLQGHADALTKAMESRTDQRVKAIQEAKMPVDGLVFGDDVVLFNDIPLEQASQAEKIRVSCAIAMASNPKIKVLLVRDASLIDDDSMAILTNLVKANGYQIWLEKVATSTKVGVLIEDGYVSGRKDEPK